MRQKPEASASDLYLRQATRGLWGRKRREVREELEAHLLERALAHRIAGLREADAIERALAELGRPQEISVGMTRLHTLPTLVGSGTALAAVCVAVVALLPNGVAQALPATFYWPSVKCVQALESSPGRPLGNDCFSADNSLWVDQQALQRALGPQGVTFEKAPGPSNEGLLKLTFPGSTPIYVSFGRDNVSVSNESGDNIEVAPGYLSFWDLVQAASYQNDLRIEVKGWDNPTVRFNDVSLQMGTDARPMSGIEFYENYLDAVFFKDLINPVPGDYVYNISPQGRVRETAVSLPDGAPDVYGVITRLDLDGPFAPPPLFPGEEPWDVVFMLSVARSDATGTVTFRLPEGPLRFVDAFTAEQPQGTSMLVRLGGGAGTGKGWYEVVAPERVAVQ